MSRLDSFIRRMSAQRDIIDHVRDNVPLLPTGAILEIGLGNGYPDKDAITLTWLPDIVSAALAPDGVAISGLPLEHPSLAPLPIPSSVDPDRYFLYRRKA